MSLKVKISMSNIIQFLRNLWKTLTFITHFIENEVLFEVDFGQIDHSSAKN